MPFRFRLLLLLMLLICVACSAGLCEEEDELSIMDGGSTERIITPGPEATPRTRLTEVPTATPTAMPDYFDMDGSVTITLTCGGELSLGGDPREEENAFERERERQNQGNGFVMRNLRDILRGDDLTIISLGTTLAEGLPVPAETGIKRVFAAEAGWAGTLKNAGVELTVLAGSHSLDFGADGLEATAAALRQADISVSLEGQLATVTVKGIRVGVLSYNAVNREEHVAQALPQDLAVVTPLHDITVVYINWGSERSYIPDNGQIRLGRLAAEHGASLVLGSGPSHVHPIEDYHGAYIVYSMGNLTSLALEKPADMSAYLFQLQFRYFRGATERLGFRIIPIRIATSVEANDFCPTPLSRDTAIDSIITTLLANGASLEFAVQEYPLAWR